jgi:hypothetical protein
MYAAKRERALALCFSNLGTTRWLVALFFQQHVLFYQSAAAAAAFH